MGKLTILFLIVSLYIFFTHTAVHHGLCEPIVNDNVCIDKSFFKNLTKSKSFQVVANIKFSAVKGVTMFHPFMKSNMIATIENINDEIIFTVNCFLEKIGVKKQNFVSFKLKISRCNIFDSIEYMEIQNKNLDFKSFTYSKPIQTTIFKADEYLSFWGCTMIENQTFDVASWVLIDNEKNVELSTSKLEEHLSSFVRKFRNFNNGTNFKLRKSAFTVFNISDEKSSCLDPITEDAFYERLKFFFPMNFSAQQKKTPENEKYNIKVAIVVLAFLGLFVFAGVFLIVGYNLLVRYIKY